MIREEKLKWFYGICTAFIAVNSLLFFTDFYWLSLLPVALIVSALAFFSLDVLLLIVVFFTPLSVNIEDLDFGLGIILPTEPLIFGIMVLFIFKLLYEKKYDKRVFTHSVSIAILFHLLWLGITTITSELPIVSLKFVIARFWYIAAFYFIAIILFRNEKNFRRYLWVYIVPLTAVVAFTVIRHSTFGFEEKPAHWVMQPFFKDHTSYGAVLAMFFPFVVASFWDKKLVLNQKIIVFFLTLLLATGIVFSYTRAAWVSLAIAFVVFVIMKLRIKFSILALAGLLLIGGFFAFQDEILMELEKNRQDSSSDLAEHVQSISNIASDASNLERLNRWNAALSMFAEKPFFGWGPGTYMFLYAPFQQSEDLTIISTNFGDQGNAHSEYLGPLAETGVLGLLSILAIISLVAYKAVILYGSLKDSHLRLIVLGCFLGLITYYAHGVLNNYLDMDKAAAPFWGFSAMIVAIDIYYKKESKKPAAQ